MGRRMYMSRGEYPTDESGFPIPVQETDIPYLESGHNEVHHLAFYRRTFGELAISQTFRDLKSNQLLMPSRSHGLLHQLYDGIRLPPVANMLDYIEHAQYTGDKLNIREPRKGYQQYDITEEYLDTLYREYNFIVHKL